MLRGARRGSVLALLWLFAAARAQGPGATLPDNLADFRALAAALGKAGPGKDTSVVLEYRVDRHANPCAGETPESALRLHGDGRLSLLVTRSSAETEVHGPGRFSGRLPRSRWESAFARLAAMKWVEQSFLPMPGVSETRLTLRLARGGKEAEFAFAGAVPPGQALISGGIDAAADLEAEARRDTLWSLGLAVARAKAGPAGLSLEALWTNRGRKPVTIRLPSADKPPACGSLELAWSAPPPREPGVTPLPPELRRASPGIPLPAGAWKEVGPGDTLRLPLVFPVPKGKGARSGRLTHLGLGIAEPGARDSLPATLFSGGFAF